MSEFERRQEDAAAAEAGAIGGVAGGEDLDPAQRPLIENGEGVAEGFEQSEEALIENATHGDQHSARIGLYDAGEPEDDRGTSVDGEADHVRSSEDDDLDR